MKTISFVVLFILISFNLDGHTQDNKQRSSESVSSDMKFGHLILELPFDAKLYNVTDTDPQEFLANIKSSFKDKSLLIIFWATWCSPCLEEMPQGKRLYVEAKGLPVEFIWLCTSAGTSQDKWITKISVLKQPGIHMFVDEKLENGLADFFSKGGFPNYLFINADGEYIPEAITRLTSTTDIKRTLDLYNR
jgi:thiol-disulfide isomerase/thioredoxin